MQNGEPQDMEKVYIVMRTRDSNKQGMTAVDPSNFQAVHAHPMTKDEAVKLATFRAQTEFQGRKYIVFAPVFEAVPKPLPIETKTHEPPQGWDSVETGTEQ